MTSTLERRALANYGARLLLKEDLADREGVNWFRAAVRDGRWGYALDWFGPFRWTQRFLFLKRAIPLMDPDQRVRHLLDAWTNAKMYPHTQAVLRLFRAVPELRNTVPPDWPDVIDIWRGVAARDRQHARRELRAPSWTITRDIAVRFATPYPGFADMLHGFVAAARVERDKVLAFIDDPTRNEAEVIVDPVDVRDLQLEALPSAPKQTVTQP